MKEKLKKKEQVPKVLQRLLEVYKDPKTELTYDNPFHLLIAVILSAQCTDAQVNRVTPILFKKYPTPEALAKARLSEVEKIIHSTGFFRAKAKAIVHTSKDLVDKFSSKVPRTLEELVTLRGVGRKTASVVLNQAFSLPAIAVDTHVKRVSLRLGWAHDPRPEKIEQELKDLVPMKDWAIINGLLILHGRKLCKARAPLCPECPVAEFCDYFRSHA